jgi:hypothetical protein
VSDKGIGERFEQWARSEPSIVGLVAIGSRVRAAQQAGAADENSDFDFQVIITDSATFEHPSWLDAAGLGRPAAHAARAGRLGSARKITVVFTDGELDLVLIPAWRLRLAGWLLRFRLTERIAVVKGALAGLSTVLHDGYVFRKGEQDWGALYSRISSTFLTAPLDDDEVRALAEGFVCDYVSTHRKIARGEYLAAQRWLHVQLAETNFRLAHELRMRRGASSFPDARRLEFLLESNLDALTVSAAPDAQSLQAAADKAAATCRMLVRQLVGDAWRWPELPALSSGATHPQTRPR